MSRRSRLFHSRPTRCVDGRLMRHDPQFDDPYLETDRGQCPECGGKGCDDEEESETERTIREEHEREERLNNGPFGVGA